MGSSPHPSSVYSLYWPSSEPDSSNYVDTFRVVLSQPAGAFVTSKPSQICKLTGMEEGASSTYDRLALGANISRVVQTLLAKARRVVRTSKAGPDQRR